MKVKNNIFQRVMTSGFTMAEVAGMFGCNPNELMLKQCRSEWEQEDIETFVCNYRRKLGIVVDVCGVLEP